LLLQLRKRRKNRSATKASEEDAVAAAAAATTTALEATNDTAEVLAGKSSPEAKEKNEVKESESDDSDVDGQQISDISDSELEVDNYYFLQVKRKTKIIPYANIEQKRK
jgi:hypothetical protein